MTGSSNQGGFSLLEVLITASILGLIGALFAPTLYGASRLWSRQSAVAQVTEDDRIVRRVLEQLADRAVNPGRTGGTITFSASARRLDMVVRTETNGLERVELAWQARPDGAALVLHIEPLLTPSYGELDVVLIDRLVHGSFRYFGQPPGGDARTWQTVWPDGQVPDLLEVQLERPAARGLPPAMSSMAIPFSALAPLHCPSEARTNGCAGGG